MIYLPQRALFIHIPRTGGNSITNAIASTCAGNGIDVLIGTASAKIHKWHRFHRHAHADMLKKFIDEWDDIFKFAIYRPEEDRLDSLQRLIQRDLNLKIFNDPTCPKGWKNFLLSDEDRQMHIDSFKKRDWDFYTKDSENNDIGVHRYDFDKLNELWPEICDNCKIPRCPLPHLNSA
jgi:hypothetical protein